MEKVNDRQRLSADCPGFVYRHILLPTRLSGEEVPSAEPGGPHEGAGPHRGGEEQTLCVPCGGEES